MNQSKGLWEELKQSLKKYPEENQRIYPVHPQEYAHSLTQQIARDISLALEKLAMDNRFEEMTTIANAIRSDLYSKVGFEHLTNCLDTPIHFIHYRFDDEHIPYFPNTYLTHPSFISNEKTSGEEQNLFKALKFELLTADTVEIMVSFIRWSGLQLLWRSFLDLARRNTPVRILTTNYLHVTEPKALRKLLNLSNVSLRMFVTEQESFHTKAYLFGRNSGLDTFIIGSSNISHSALKTGHEWNVKLPRVSHNAVFSSARAQFENLWNDNKSVEVTDELIQYYELDYQQSKNQQAKSKVKQIASVQRYFINSLLTAEDKSTYISDGTNKLEPNEMQRPALAALEQTRENGYTKGVIVAATGTGKTYLSAFDAQSFGAKPVLFLAHRDELLESAKGTFIEVFGNANLCGKLTGFERQFDRPFLFSTVQMMYREDVLSRFQPDHFDYIVVDEFHHAQANTYRQVLDHFQPKFLLGLTATPERMDGRDVLELCEHNLVYEIRLRDALSEGLLAPFHYFGLSDPTVNYDEIEQRSGRFVEQDLFEPYVLTNVWITSSK